MFHHRNCPLHPMYDIFLVLVLLLSLVMFSLSSCSYLEKFTDFLRLFVSVHLRRIESSPQFPIVEFLALLFKYTFNQVIIIWLNSHLFMQCTPKVVHFYTFFLQNMSSERLHYFFSLGFSLPTKATLPVWIYGVSFWIF